VEFIQCFIQRKGSTKIEKKRDGEMEGSVEKIELKIVTGVISG